MNILNIKYLIYNGFFLKIVKLLDIFIVYPNYILIEEFS